MIDRFGRNIEYMRLSITDKCNYRCIYCMPEEGVCDIGHENILRYEEFLIIVRAAVSLGIRKFRLTGGEPLVRKGVVDFVKRLKSIRGVEELTMTTNGSLLKSLAQPLKDAGLDRVNISLDSLRHTRFKLITRGGNLNDVFEGINSAWRAGLTPIKINTVVMKNFNDDEIMDFVQLTLQYPFEVRFIELMPFSGNENMDYQYISNEDIKAKLPALKEAGANNGVAQLYTYPGALGKIGFISPLSHCFCESCNKVRVTADGKLKTCLHSNKEYDLSFPLKESAKNEEETFEIVKKKLEAGILGKEKRHKLLPGVKTVDRNMNKIGG